MLGRFQETLRIWRRAHGAASASTSTASTGRSAAAAWRPPASWPLWGGGNAAPAAIRRSAEYGEAWTCGPDARRRPGTRKAGLYRERARELGKVPFVVRMQDGWVADTRAAALRRHRPALRAHGRLLRALGHGPRLRARGPRRRTCWPVPPPSASSGCERAARGRGRRLRRLLLPPLDRPVAGGRARADRALRRGGRGAGPRAATRRPTIRRSRRPVATRMGDPHVVDLEARAPRERAADRAEADLDARDVRAAPPSPPGPRSTVFQLSQEIGCVCVRWSAPALTVIVAS